MIVYFGGGAPPVAWTLTRHFANDVCYDLVRHGELPARQIVQIGRMGQIG